jgi:anti-sigma factor RsiW
MNREEAQFILRAYRPSGEDAHDPQFEEALALVRNDPELARWFAREQALDAAIAGRIHSVPPPPDLRTQLLLARKVIRPRPWWRKPAWIAAAALVALLISAASLLLLRRNGEAEFASFRGTMIEASLDMRKHIDVMGLDADELKQWLIEHRGHPGFVLPPGLADKGIMGCKVLDWHGHRVTLLCLKFGGKHVDVFVVNESDLPGVSVSAAPEFSSERGMTTVTWRREGKIYFLAGNIPESELKQLL